MDFETYEKDRRAGYETLAETIALILESAIRADTSMRLQQVQHRAKDPARLKQKLENRELIDTATLEADIKDLAGCRLVFLTNADVSRFLNSGIIHDNFEVDWDRTKIHHPRAEADEATELFISNNYVVALQESRTALPEYSGLRDMWCEVQVQTSLNHAWSEMAHDTIYKKPKIAGFGGKLFQGIEARMRMIMRKHLLPAGYEFQKVVDDFERLLAGKDLFDQGALEALADCNDNNTRLDLLERFAKSVLPYYDDVLSVYPDIRAHIVAAVNMARSTPTKAIETPFGEIRGRTVEQIVDVAAGILESLRYLDIEATFDAICELFPGAESETERKRLLKLSEGLSKHELEVWKQVGPEVQLRLVKRIEALDADLLDPLTPVLLSVLSEVLKPTITGTSSTYQTVTFNTGVVIVSEELTHARTDAIAFLKSLFQKAETDHGRDAVVQALTKATTTPNTTGYSDDFLEMILETSREIVEFYTEIVRGQSYEFVQYLENRVFFLHRRNRDMPAEALASLEIRTARDELTESILAFRNQVNTDRDFEVYKILVGYRSVFPPAWDDGDFNLREQTAYRERRFAEFVEAIDKSNAEEWLKTLTRCARTESRDGATFLSFVEFLERLGEAKPQIVIDYLDQLEEPLANFLSAMLSGVSKTPHKGEVREKVKQWVSEKVHLRQIATYLSNADSFDADLLQRTSSAAVERNDDIAVILVVRAAVARHRDISGDLIDTVFLPALRHLTAKGDQRWVDMVVHNPNEESLFRDLSAEQADEVLKHLVSVPEIEYHTEEVLTSIANRWPEKVVDFFGHRLTYSEIANETSDYDVVPFELHQLHQSLSKVPEYVVDAARGWFDDADPLFMFNGGRLVQIIFPEFPSELREQLISVVRSGQRSDIQFVIAILRSYSGQVLLHEVAKEIVEELAANDPLLEKVEAALAVTGVVLGEFGRVAALKQRKTEVQVWLTDDREKVRAFAERQIRGLDRQVASEQRWSEERLEQRKRNYDTGPGEED